MKFELNEQTKGYFNRRISDFESNRLTGGEEKQLFQDLQDSGYINHLPQYFQFMRRLIKTGLVVTSQGKALN